MTTVTTNTTTARVGCLLQLLLVLLLLTLTNAAETSLGSSTANVHRWTASSSSSSSLPELFRQGGVALRRRWLHRQQEFAAVPPLVSLSSVVSTSFPGANSNNNKNKKERKQQHENKNDNDEEGAASGAIATTTAMKNSDDADSLSSLRDTESDITVMEMEAPAMMTPATLGPDDDDDDANNRNGKEEIAAPPPLVSSTSSDAEKEFAETPVVQPTGTLMNRSPTTTTSSSTPLFLTGSAARLSALKRSLPAIRRKSQKALSKTIEVLSSTTATWQPPRAKETGFFYGLSTPTLWVKPSQRRVPLRETVSLTLEELHNLREDMQAMRLEIQRLQEQLAKGGSKTGGSSQAVPPQDVLLLSPEDRLALYEQIGQQVEEWAERILQEQDGWVEVKCSKVLKRNFNPDDRTTAELKWIPDSRLDTDFERAEALRSDDDENDAKKKNKAPKKEEDLMYPCIRVQSTIDAPPDLVNLFLSQQDHLREYNDLVDDNRDLEILTPNSKICWAQTPQILFLQPRHLLTYCQHKWLADGTQVILNQACNQHIEWMRDHKKKSKPLVAYALRGANYIGPHPDDPSKTLVTMIAHGNPGHDVPKWAMKTAVQALAVIEPFKLFHRINTQVQRHAAALEESLQEQAQLVQHEPAGRSRRPAGVAQLGYACFWPQGGGTVSDNKTLSSVTVPETAGRMLGNDDDDMDDAPDSQAAASASSVQLLTMANP